MDNINVYEYGSELNEAWEELDSFEEEQEDEQEEKEIEPSWTEAYLNTLGLSMSDFV